MHVDDDKILGGQCQGLVRGPLKPRDTKHPRRGALQPGGRDRLLADPGQLHELKNGVCDEATSSLDSAQKVGILFPSMHVETPIRCSVPSRRFAKTPSERSLLPHVQWINKLLLCHALEALFWVDTRNMLDYGPNRL
eukprot:6177425-Heterocapsa_arctica.AAC.1